MEILSVSTFRWMLLTNLLNISSSFKKITFNDSFFFVGEDHEFRKMTPTNATLKITVNKQCNELNPKMTSLQCKIRRRRKNK